MIVIGLIGAKGSGKSTFAAIAKKRFPFVQEGALANKLKDVCSAFLGIPRLDFDDPNLKEQYLGKYLGRPAELNSHNVASIMNEFGIIPTTESVNPHVYTATFFTPRQVAQYIGTEVLRSIDPDIHCKGLMQDQPKDGVLIVTDIRFPNELEFFMNKFGSSFFPIYIANAHAEAAAAKDAHESEAHVQTLAKSCRHIDNEESLDVLEMKVVNLLSGIFSQYTPEELGQKA